MTAPMSKDEKVREARIDQLRSEIRRCDEAIEAGGADSWWHIDRDRFRAELDKLTTPTPPAQAEASTLPGEKEQQYIRLLNALACQIMDQGSDVIKALHDAAITAQATPPTTPAVESGEPVAWAPEGHIARYLKGRNTACWVYGSPTGPDNEPLYASRPAVESESADRGAVERVRNLPYDPNDDYQEVRRDERERIIAAIDGETT